MKEREVIEEKLLSFKRLLEKEWNKFNPRSEELEVWKDSFSHEIKGLLKEIDYTLRVLQAPVFVGLLGRYSHGKTALANALFGILEDYALPEGEGIVTSKITRIDFEENIAFPRAYIVKRGNEREEIEIGLLRKLARSSEDTSLKESSLIDFLHLQLSAQSGFSRLFAQKRISLIDMPGLGGPYFKDSIRTQKYLETMDFILVVIKITEIDKAGKVIERFVANTKLPPVICVFTFYDKANEFPLFKGLDDEDIQQKAMELAKEHIPSLSREIETASIFVSSKTQLNIEELREFMLNFVERRVEAVDKIREETPKVFRRKMAEMKQEILRLESKINNLLNKLSSSQDLDIARSIDQLPIFRRSEREEKRELRSVRKEVAVKLRDVQKKVESTLISILDASDCSQAKGILEDIETEIKNLIGEVEAELNNQFNDRIKPLLKDNAMKFVERELDLPPDKKERLEEDIERELEGFRVFFDWDKEITLSRDFYHKCIASQGKDLSRRITANFSNPQFLQGIGFSIVIIVVGQFIGKIPMIGNDLSSIFNFLGMLGIIGSVAYAIIMTPGNKAYFNKLLRDSYRSMKVEVNSYFSELEKYVNELMDDTLKELKNSILEEIGSETNEVVKDIRNLRELTKRLENEFFEIKNSMENFVKAVSVGS
jgi:predicted GTPase